MKKLVGSALVALMLEMTGVGSFAATQQSNKEIAAATNMTITGEVALIKGHTLKVEDQAGKEHTYRLGKPEMLQDFKAGEKVTIALENGKVTSIKKFEVAKPAEHGTGAK